MVNFLPTIYGSAFNRAGTHYVQESADTAAGNDRGQQSVRVVQFQFSVFQGYILEFGHQYIRFYANDGIVVNGGSPVQISSPYSYSDLFLLKFEQSADKMTINHPNYTEYTLTRTSSVTFTLTQAVYGPGQAPPTGLGGSGGSGSNYTYCVTANNSNQIESVGSNSAGCNHGGTLSWSPPSGPSPQFYRIYEQDNGAGTWYSIGVTSSTSYTVPATVTRDDSLSPPQQITALNQTSNDYPGGSAFYGQRLIRYRTNNNPQTLFGSVVGDFYNFNYSNPTQDNDAFQFQMAATQVNEVRWIMSLAQALIFTSGSEWLMQPGGSNTTVTPTSVDLTRQSTWGCANVKPVSIGNNILFVERSGQSVRNMVYSLALNAYDGDEVSLLAAHMIENNSIIEWAYQQHPNRTVWAVTTNGTLVGLTYQVTQRVICWHRHITDGTFESVAVLNNSTGLDEVWVVVRRVINGKVCRFIEYFDQRNFTTIQNAYFVDCGATYSGSPTTTITGLTWLKNTPVTVLADGNVISGLTVSSTGTITLPVAASIVTVGLPYNCDLETTDFTQPTQNGHIYGKARQVVQIHIALLNTRECWVGPGLDENGGYSLLTEIPFRSFEDYGDPVQLFSGEKREIGLNPITGTAQSSVFIHTQNPLPCTVRAITAEVSYGD